ncbi:elastin-like [Serinus canaria]|uniref:elastin-like n=1 Tax=Serinus canaria TaxID=9135 RepID=UPI0021CCD8B1|nr:elastin-like [Serinus canaria]
MPSIPHPRGAAYRDRCSSKAAAGPGCPSSPLPPMLPWGLVRPKGAGSTPAVKELSRPRLPAAAAPRKTAGGTCTAAKASSSSSSSSSSSGGSAGAAGGLPSRGGGCAWRGRAAGPSLPGGGGRPSREMLVRKESAACLRRGSLRAGGGGCGGGCGAFLGQGSAGGGRGPAAGLPGLAAVAAAAIVGRLPLPSPLAGRCLSLPARQAGGRRGMGAAVPAGCMGVSRGALRPAAPRCPGPLPPARSVFIGAAAAPPSALCNNTAITCGKRGAGGKQKPGQQPGGGGRRVGLGELPPFNLSLSFFFSSLSPPSLLLFFPSWMRGGGREPGKVESVPVVLGTWPSGLGTDRLGPRATARLGPARLRHREEHWERHRDAALPCQAALALPAGLPGWGLVPGAGAGSARWARGTVRDGERPPGMSLNANGAFCDAANLGCPGPCCPCCNLRRASASVCASNISILKQPPPQSFLQLRPQPFPLSCGRESTFASLFSKRAYSPSPKYLYSCRPQSEGC